MSQRPSPKFTLSAILGLLLVPAAAIGAVVLTGGASEADASSPSVAPEVQQVVFGAVEPATGLDLARACGDAGLVLVGKESVGETTPVEQAALDALRPICEAHGTPLPGGAASVDGAAAVQAAAAVVPPAAAPASTTATTATTVGRSSTTVTTSHEEEHDGEDRYEEAEHEEAEHEEAEHEEAEHEDESTSASSAMAEYERVHAIALSEIDKAVAQGGEAEKIDEARRKLAEAERDAAAGKYDEARTHSWEAVGKARESLGED